MPVALLTVPFARSGLWRIFRIALEDSRFGFHSSLIVIYADGCGILVQAHSCKKDEIPTILRAHHMNPLKKDSRNVRFSWRLNFVKNSDQRSGVN